MKNRSLIIIGAVILVSLILLELFPNYILPYQEYRPNLISDIDLVEFNAADYYKDGIKIGTYKAIFEGKDQSSGFNTYTISTKTEIIYKEKPMTVDSRLIINDRMRIVGYSVNASINNISSVTTVTMHGSNANVTNIVMEDSVTLDVNIPDNAIVIDNTQPIHWELLFKSFKFELGKRYRVLVFVPQVAMVQSWEISVDQNPQTVTINGKSYSCIVIRQSELDIQVYFSNNEMIRYRDQKNGIVIDKRVN
jgi:hypothetical protein